MTGRGAITGPRPRTYANFLKHIEDTSMPVPECGCRIWLGPLTATGYPTARFRGGMIRITRFICKVTHGPMPKEMDAAHSCFVKCCVEPTHIRPLSRSDNLREGWRKWRKGL